MLRLGEKQTLEVVKKVEFGVYLAENKEIAAGEKVLLPIKQVPQGTSVGDKVEVFIYKDSKDRFIATTNEPTEPNKSRNILIFFMYIILLCMLYMHFLFSFSASIFKNPVSE